MFEPPTCSSGKCRRILPPMAPIPDAAEDEDEALPPPPMLPRPSFGMDTDLTLPEEEAGADDAEDDDSSPRRATLARLSPSPLGAPVEAATLPSCDDEAMTAADAEANDDDEASAKDDGACACACACVPVDSDTIGGNAGDAGMMSGGGGRMSSSELGDSTAPSSPPPALADALVGSTMADGMIFEDEDAAAAFEKPTPKPWADAEEDEAAAADEEA